MSILKTITNTVSKIVSSVKVGVDRAIASNEKTQADIKSGKLTVLSSQLPNIKSVLPVVKDVIKLSTPIIKTAATVVKDFVVRNPKTAIATVTAGTIIAKSEKLKVSDIPKSFDTLTTNTARFIDNPSKETALKIYTDDPLASTVLSTLGLLGAGYVGAKVTEASINTVNTFLTDKTISDFEKYVPKTPDEVTPPVPDIPKTPTKNPASDVPITPSTQVVGRSAGGVSKHRPRSKAKYNTPSIVNRIHIDILPKTLYVHRRIGY
jgi:hypothetical protein